MTSQRNQVQRLYDEDYAESYPHLYIAPWPEKHEINLRILEEVQRRLLREQKRWLDLACGQAWHFSKTGASMRKHGIDLSYPQLRRARAHSPDAVFIQADMVEIELRASAFDLITAFWAGYCYLESVKRIETWLHRVVSWTRRGGSVYIEALLPQNLESFNRSRFAARTAFLVRPRSHDFVRWSYSDTAGEHQMTSPPLEHMCAPLVDSFERVEAIHDGHFMVHVVASGRKAGLEGLESSGDSRIPPYG